MKTQINTLPKYWVVKADQSNPDWRKVIDYLNNFYPWEGSHDAYYGYDDNKNYKGTDCWSQLSSFQNNPTLLTIEQFVQLTEGFVLPGYVKCIGIPVGWSLIKLGKIYKTCNKSYPKEDYRIIFADEEGGGGQSITTFETKSCFIPSTKEAFDKQNSKKETMRTITHTQAQEIIDAACTTWKERLFTKWGKKIVLKQEIEISDNQYQKMRKACTSDQNELFDTIFGKDIQYIPEGTPCLVRDYGKDTWKLAYSNGDDTFKWTSTYNDRWKQVQVLDINNLPRY